MGTDTPPGGPPAEETTNEGAQPVPVFTDPGGQEGPAPDTIGVPAGEGAQQVAPVPDNPAVQAGVGPEGTGVVPPEEEAEDPEEAIRAAAIKENAPPRAAPVPNVEPDAGYEGATDSVSVLDDEDSEAVRFDAPAEEGADDQAATQKVLVSLSDPAASSKVARWLERQAARDARLGPLVERLQYLPNVRLEFDADDPIFMENRPAEEPAAA